MRSIATKLLAFIGVATGIFSLFLLYQNYSLTSRRIKEVVEQQASLALTFDLAIRRYVAQNIRPLMYDLVGENDFIPESMSTSYVARSVFEDVRHEFPDYIIKFSSDNPRNPANQAGSEELKVIEYLNNNPHMKRWEGAISINGRQYMAKFSARRMKESCLRCHGDPKDAPASLLERYGSTAGFHRSIGKIIGLDTVAIPMTKITGQLWSESLKTFFTSILGLLIFFLVITFSTRLIITDRLSRLAKHIIALAIQSNYSQIEPVEMNGKDEISDLAFSFNNLSLKLKNFYSSLETKVKERTEELEQTNEHLRREVADRKRAEEARRLNESRLEALLELNQMTEASQKEITDFALEKAIKLTGSDIGYLAFMSRDESVLTMHSWSQKALDLCAMTNKPIVYPIEETGLWGEAVRQRKPIVTNNYSLPNPHKKGYPQGHVPLTRHMNIPVFDGDSIVAVAGVGNKKQPYNDSDIRQLRLLMQDMYRLLQRKQAVKERQKLVEQLQRAQKMEAIGTLAGGVAHDLNNILSGLVSYPELLLMDLTDDSPLKKPILTMKKSGEKAAAIVQDLLTLARRGVAVTKVVNLNSLISDYLLSPEFEKMKSFHTGIRIATDLETDILNIMGSSVHLSKTIMNLISNAAEAMPHGGNIFISTQNRYVDRPIRGYDEVKEGDYVVLTVRDEGIGMSQQDMERIFEPFYTKKAMGRSGTGLGMAVVWGTVKDHKGYIDIHSVEGEGTALTLYFPVTRKSLSKDTLSFSIDDFIGKGESVLIVDDVEEQREIATKMLSKLGYCVASVSNGLSAVDHIKTNGADLVVLDMIMEPGIDGLETFKRILELSPHQKAIIASGFSETKRVKEAQRLGAGPYIKKPYTLEKIGMAVRKELDHHNPL